MMELGTLTPSNGEHQDPPPRFSKARRYCLLALFCLAQFVDVYNASAVVLATSQIAEDLHMGATESVWTLSAYVLTFASFMLPLGKVADLWSAKGVFVIGLVWVGAFSLGVALTHNKVVLFLLRAFAGMGAAASIPAAINLIIHLFPGEAEQHIALAAFGGAGELANVSGFLLGGVLLLAGWRWVFWLLPIVCFPMAIISWLLVPSKQVLKTYQLNGLTEEAATGSERAVLVLRTLQDSQMQGKFDFVGSFLVVAAAVLTVFGLTDGGESGGWGRAQPIVTLVIGLALFPIFFWWESRVDQRIALIPSSIWFIRNVTILIVVSLTPYFWWYGVQYIFAVVMQEYWALSSIVTAVHFLPISIGGGIVFVLIGYLPATKFPLKIRMVAGALVAMAGTLLLVFAKDGSWYWKLVAPGMFVGSMGTAMVFISANNSLLMSVPVEYSGVVGGIFNATLQLGAVAGLAINATIQSFFVADDGSASHSILWKGYESSFIFMAVLNAVVAIVSAIWFKNPTSKGS